MTRQSNQSEEPGPSLEGPLSVYHMISVMVDQLAAIAWQKLGLQTDPLTGKIEKDLTQAKIAIDVTTEMSRFLEPELDDEDKKKTQALIRDLRMNYVEITQKK